MSLIFVGLLFLLQLFFFFSFGILITKIFHFKISSSMTLFLGFIFYFCLFGIIAVPMTLASLPLSWLTCVFMLLTVFIIASSLIFCRKLWISLLTDASVSVKKLSWTIVPLTLVILFQMITVFTHIDTSADASYYIGKVTTDVYTNTMGHFSPYTGRALSKLDNRRVIACFPEYNAVISQLFHIHPLKQAKLIMPEILILLENILFYHIGLYLFKNNHKKATGFLFFVFLINFFSYTLYTTSAFLFLRTYEGKSILGNLILPSMFYCFLMIWENDRKIFSKLLLFGISLGSCFFSSSSMLIVPIGLTAGLLPWIFKEKTYKNIFLYVLCILPNLAVCILYLLTSAGILVYHIR